jgi:DNA-directed RNA polymerase specialized sigma24 family protein
MKKRKSPWLKSTGEVLKDADLMQVSRSWDQKTWEAYLNWFQGRRQETLIYSQGYDPVLTEQAPDKDDGPEPSAEPDAMSHAEALLREMPEVDAAILRLSFIEGMTDARISRELHRSRSAITRRKNKALFVLSRGQHGERCTTRRIMKGAVSMDFEEPCSSIWDESHPQPIRDDRTYDPELWQEELGALKHPYLKCALTRLSEDAQRILYLRYFCGFPIRKIARIMGMASYPLDAICDAAVTRLKSFALDEAMREKETQSCA